MSEVVILSAARTPMGGFQGELSGMSATELGAAAIQPLVSLQALVFRSVNGLISGRVGPNEQGAVQGVIGSMVALGSVFGPLLLTQTLAYFTETGAPVYFPGAAFLLAALLMAFSLIALTLELGRQARVAARA